MNKKKTLFWIEIVSGLLFSIVLTLLFPSNIGKGNSISGVNFNNKDSLILQRISSVSFTPRKITKIYYDNQLLGVLLDDARIDEITDIVYKEKYKNQFEGCVLNLASEIYTVSENSFWQYEDKDDEIIKYLYENELFEIEAYRIDIDNTTEYASDIARGEYSIYVLNEEDFNSALKRYVLRYIDEDAYEQLQQGKTVANPEEYGVVDKGIYMISTITCQRSGASYDEILASEDEIYQFLCYGNHVEPKYYTVLEYDSISGVATKNGLNPDVLMMLNENLLSKTQSLTVGEQLNVCPFESPITIMVQKMRYEKQITQPGEAEYIKDSTLENGKKVLISEASNGYDDVYTMEYYVNGTIVNYARDKELTHTVVAAIPAVYHYNGKNDTQGRILILPVENPAITCSYGDVCYADHHGTDFIDRYHGNGKVMSICDGEGMAVGYDDNKGNYVYVDIGEGYVIRYYHMQYTAIVKVGAHVVYGQQLGNIGTTGNSTGNHLHIAVVINGEWSEPCDFLPCELAVRWG